MAKAKKTTKRAVDISEQLLAAIASCELNLREIAIGAEVPYPMVYRFARGQRDIRLATAAKIAAYLCLELAPKKSGKSR